MGDNAAVKNHHHQVFDVSAAVAPEGSRCFDDDGRLKRTGTAWTASAHIITAVIGPELLSLAWATAQLGWIAGPTALFFFSIVTYYTSTLLAACYRSGDPANGERNYTYMDAVRSNLGGMKVKICGWTQYLNLFGVAIGYTIAASISMMAVKRSNCFHASGGKGPCKISRTPYMLAFEGYLTPGNLLTGFGFYNPFWLLDIANVAIVVHLLGAYQVYCQPLFAFVEKTAAEWFPDSEFIKKEYKIPTPIPGFSHFRLNFFRLVWRTLFVILTTVISMLMPFFNGVVRILGAFGFGLLTVYFPVEIYIVQKKIPKWSTRWMSLQILRVACLVISIAAVIGSFAGLVEDLKSYKPFKSSY
ncbi:hypothetical protein RHGRI_031684 [Rhododendron griersonianum]|uniref:Amino acid transporter transmembrane domain-containing protein n=1 Tax=Rhododendron griersonianum TaxID=479676 RepID=A0AAV6IB50_9ERIC|nr:hypothetical protein RHGRI_031684 [Rhododendron griersonianum]